MKRGEFEFTTATPHMSSARRLVGAIRLNQEHITVAEDVFVALGSPDRVTVDYDIKHQAIRLTPAATGGYRLGASARDMRSKLIRVRTIQKKLPLGRYVPIDTNTFIHVGQYK